MSKGVFTVLQYLNTDEDNVLTGATQVTKSSPTTLGDVMRVSSMYMVSAYKPHVACVYEYVKSGAEGSTGFIVDKPTSISFPMKSCNGDFLSDQVVHIVLDAIGSPSADPTTAERYRYFDLPGIRLFPETNLQVERVNIDTYDETDMLFHRNFDTDTNKILGLDTIYGQEQLESAVYYSPGYQTNQQFFFTNGPQTYKTYQPQLEMWIPLKFWYNCDPAQALQNVMFKTLDKYITCSITAIDKLISVADPSGVEVTGATAGRKLRIVSAELYTRNIYVTSDIQDLMFGKSAIQLIRVHRRQSTSTIANHDDILLSQIKYPLEYLSFGFRPNANARSPDDWHKFGNIRRVEYPVPVFIPGIVPQLVARTAVSTRVVPIVTQLGLRVYGNDIYPLMNESFFSKYLPFTTPFSTAYGVEGIYMINFANVRRGYALSGYLNNSTARELYLRYTTASPGAISETTIYISAKALNFLIYTAGTVSLKYVT